MFFLSNGNQRVLQLEAYGQDVTLIDSLVVYADYTFSAEKPYMIRHYIASAPEATVTIEKGARFYMHKDASAVFYGPVKALGTTDEPIEFSGDRLDDYVAGIPYLYVPGQWAGIYLYRTIWLLTGIGKTCAFCPPSTACSATASHTPNVPR